MFSDETVGSKSVQGAVNERFDEIPFSTPNEDLQSLPTPDQYSETLEGASTLIDPRSSFSLF